MSSHHSRTLNFSHSPYKNPPPSIDVDQEIKLGEFRLRYVKLMRDIHLSLGQKKASELIEESITIWEKLNY